MLAYFTVKCCASAVDESVTFFIRSSTGEQYGELEQLLQDISDLMREADYVPKTVPWRGNGIAPWWTVGFLTSAKALCK